MSVKAVPAPEISADEFQALEEKVYRTIEQLKTMRDARAAAERESSRLRAEIDEKDEELESSRRELIALRREREDVKGRVEKLLRQLDELTAGEGGR